MALSAEAFSYLPVFTVWGGRTDAQKHPTHTHTHTASHRSLCSQAWATPDSHTQTNAHSDTQTFGFHSFKRKSL